MCRSVPGWVLVTTPKFVSCTLLSGVPNCGVLNRFSASKRNSARNLSVIGKYLKTEKSRVLVGGEVLLCSPRLPSVRLAGDDRELIGITDRKSTRLNSSHLGISYAVF